MILNFDQTPLGFTSPNKVTFPERGVETVPIVNVDDIRHITGTSCASLSGEFLPLQLIYAGLTDTCHSNVISHIHLTIGQTRK